MGSELSASGTHFLLQKSVAGDCSGEDNLPEECRFSWYWNRRHIENYSPSRKDGIDLRKETHLRMLYCSFLKDIGARLGVPQVTVATAIVFCHRFYLHQSHAKNEWQTIATVCMFLASKVEDTPCSLGKVVTVAYETMYQKDPSAARRIHQKDVFEKQKALILIGENLVLCTIRFDFDVQHPYKPLHEAFKKLQITQTDVKRTAWNLLNDWLRTTLCLQYKPNYIAAGSLYLAAKHHNMKLSSGSGCVWWQVVDAMPLQLDAVVQQMMELLGHKRRPVATPAPEKPKPAQLPIATVVKEEASGSPDSCVLSRDGSSSGSPNFDVNEVASAGRPVGSNDQKSSTERNLSTQACCELRDLENTQACCELRDLENTQACCELRVPENPDGVVEDCREISRGIDEARMEPDQNEQGLAKINVDRIKTLMRMRKRSRESNKCIKALDESSDDAWIERELEAGIELAARGPAKRQRPHEIL